MLERALDALALLTAIPAGRGRTLAGAAGALWAFPLVGATVGALAGGDLKQALSRITAKTCVIAFSEDMFVPLQDCRDEQQMIAGSQLEVLDSLWGHFTTL
ncbi:MAG: hypothetical protein EB832_01235, partial [Thaumarchaeota archaeon S14]